ncbi:unnamed protein product [Arabidopsis arenosa]|uniref:Uncharacterized protein n=1 Tax=Arabidopsis arenosa TaxID=38785 RepID=A0A8S1ZQE0_ARAAE|nr:unnamed protein product [Arabidopsis arenosa]
MSDWVGDTSDYTPWKELVYQSDHDDPDFEPPESESDVVDSGIESGDEGDGEDASVGGDDSDSEGEEGQREKKPRRKENKVLREEDIMERFEFEMEDAVANWFDAFQIRRGVIPESDNEDEDPVVTRDRKIRWKRIMDGDVQDLKEFISAILFGIVECTNGDTNKSNSETGHEVLN